MCSTPGFYAGYSSNESELSTQGRDSPPTERKQPMKRTFALPSWSRSGWSLLRVAAEPRTPTLHPSMRIPATSRPRVTTDRSLVRNPSWRSPRACETRGSTSTIQVSTRKGAWCLHLPTPLLGRQGGLDEALKGRMRVGKIGARRVERVARQRQPVV